MSPAIIISGKIPDVSSRKSAKYDIHTYLKNNSSWLYENLNWGLLNKISRIVICVGMKEGVEKISQM
jgi:hypothetical protein